MLRRYSFIIISIFLGILLSACQIIIPIEKPDLQPTEVPTEQPPVNEDDGKYVYGENATIENLEILLMESFPLQAQVKISGYFRDGCTEMYNITVERRGMEFILTLTTRRPDSNVPCTMALEFFEETVDLDIEGLKAGTYAVIAQDQQTEFTLDVDNVMPEGEDDMKYSYGSDAVVEEMQLNLMESFPVQVSLTLKGYLPDGCTEIHEITSSREDQAFTIDIVTKRPSGDVSCIMMIVPFEETISLDVEGLPAGEYEVCYGDDCLTFELAEDNEL